MSAPIGPLATGAADLGGMAETDRVARTARAADTAALEDLAGAAETDAADARLREACAQLEGVFFEQLLKALRETIPEGGVIDGGTAEEVFSGLLDGQLATQAAAGLERGLGAALYRQLRDAIAPEAT